MDRRLAAILAVDVVGYSRLMGDDEAGTLSVLQSHREALIEPKAALYHGRTVKLMGDGALMEFGSVVDAVTFAVEIQIAMRRRNAGVTEDRQIVFRIGINLGDVILQDEDIYGDGVNVAARLEGFRSGRLQDRPPPGHHRVTIHREIDNAAELFPCLSQRRAKIQHSIAGEPVAGTRAGPNLEGESREGAEDFRIG